MVQSKAIEPAKIFHGSKSFLLPLIIALFLLSGIVKNVVADTNVSGYISADTTWTSGNSPYVVTGNVIVNSGITLTIEPGVIVKFYSGKALQVNGTLKAKGSSSSKITFTKSSSSNWGYILFNDSSTDASYDSSGNYTSGSIMEYCVVEYAGGVSVSNNGAVRMDNAHPFINYCTIQNNSASGIYAWNLSGTLKITNSTISSNSSSSSGGGIYSSSTATISNNHIVRNSAVNAAAIWSNSSSGKYFQYNTITGNNATGSYTIYISSLPIFNYNNIISNIATYELWNDNDQNSSTLDTKNNWWDTNSDSTIQEKIYDYLDDSTKGIVDYSPYATSIRTDCPISPPTGLTATAGTSQITLSWSANTEYDIKGYKVYWDTDSGHSYSNSTDVGNVTSYTITGLTGSKYYVTVTAYDTSYNSSSDDTSTIVNENQTNGNESWYAEEQTVTFSSDTTPPTVSSTSPASGATGVAVNTAITATFSEAMDSTTISTSTFTLSSGVTGTVSYDSTTRTATFTPSSNLSYSTTYTATITTGVKDSAGNTMSSNYTWSFTTISVPDSSAPTGSISINSGATYTKSTSITLTLSATDSIGVTGYYLSTSSSTPSASASGWTTVSSTTSYSGSVSYTLSGSDGTKAVYVWYKDASGNVSNVASDDIILDTTIPTVTITSPTSGSTYTTTSSTINLSGSASDSTSGISAITWSSDKGNSGTASGTTSWSISGISLSSGDNVITVTAIDGANNANTDSITVTYSVYKPTPSPTPTLTDGLVAYYPFNGNANDESGNGNHGTVYGATLTNDRNGNTNKAYSFDGTDDYINIGSDSSLKMRDGLTISVWINMNYYTPIYQNIISDQAPNETTEGVGKMLRFNYSELQFHVGGIYGYGTAVYVKHTFTNSMLNQWHYVAGTYDRNTIKLYLNGAEVASRQYTSQLAANSNSILIGKSGFGEYLYGKVDEVRMYNRALSESEIQELYNEGGSATPIPTTSPTPQPSPTPSISLSPTPARKGILFGFVYNEDIEPLKDVTVNIKGMGLSKSTKTDEEGYYEFTDLEAGEYTLTYKKNGYGTQSQEVSLEEEETLEVKTVIMEEVIKGMIYGYVLNIYGDPLEAVRLKLKGIRTEVKKNAVSDADGYFEFKDLEADTYLIFATKRFYKKEKQTVKLEEGEDKEIEIEMKKTRKKRLLPEDETIGQK